METKEIDIEKNKSIRLPQEWKSGRAFVIESPDTLIIKRYSTPADFSYIRERLRQARGRISDKEIEQEIQAYRKTKKSNENCLRH